MRKNPRNYINDISESQDWLESSRPAFAFCLFLFFLFFCFFLIFFFFVPIFHTDGYVHVQDPLGILQEDDDDSGMSARIVEEEPSTVGMRQVVLPGEKKEWVLRMPYPRGVDEEIMDRKHEQCANYSLFACGKWKGHGKDWIDRSFGSAVRDSQRRLDMILQLEAAQYSQIEKGQPMVRDERSIGGGGAFHDIVYSCINSAIYPNEASDLDYARETLLQFEPEDAAMRSQTYVGAYAMGFSVVYGDKPGLSILMTMNPRKTSESLLEWRPSSEINSMFLLSDQQIHDHINAACLTLMAVELFPWNLWDTQEVCVSDFRSLIGSLMTQTAQASTTATSLSMNYIFHHMEEDLYDEAAWKELVGADFAEGIEDGMHAAMSTFGPVLEQEGLSVPDLSKLRKWTRYAPLVQWIASTSEQPHWFHFMRAMFVMGNYQYEELLLRNPTSNLVRSASLSTSLSAHSHGLPLHTIHKNADPRFWQISRDTLYASISSKAMQHKQMRKEIRQELLGDDPLTLSALIRSDLWRRCAWLSMEYMPAEVDNSIARTAVKEDERVRVHQITDWIVQAMVEDVRDSNKLSDAGKEAILDKLMHVRARVAVPWDVDGPNSKPPLSVPYDIDPDASYLRNVRKTRARNVIQGMIEGVRSHGRQPEERPSLSHTFQLPTSAVNAYYDPTSNQMFFMVGILTPPFFSIQYNDATQLATLGSIIGHELSHAFDSNGKYFTKDGSLGSFLPDDVTQRYEDAEACFVKQYSDAPTPNGNTVDGKQTLGENMADVMGLRLAYRALWNLHRGEGDVPEEAKREFVEAYAQIWCTSADKKTEADRARMDVHAPGPARIHGALRNLVDPQGNHVLESLYGCAAGEPMHPKDICSVW